MAHPQHQLEPDDDRVRAVIARRWLPFALVALAGCQEQDQASATAPANRSAPPSVTASAAPAPKAAAAVPRCVPPPQLRLAADFGDRQGKFGASSPSFAALEKNFAAAYAKACEGRVFARRPLIEPGVPHPGTVFLINAPESNVASFHSLGEPPRADMALEYHFVTGEGAADVPSAADLHEAIYCAVHGATKKEEEKSGRCLPD